MSEASTTMVGAILQMVRDGPLNPEMQRTGPTLRLAIT
jgi:hypothetical protein